MNMKVKGISYEFKPLVATDFFDLKNQSPKNVTPETANKMAMQILLSKGVTRDGQPIEIQDAGALPIKVAPKFMTTVSPAAIAPNDGGAISLGDVQAGVALTEDFILNGKNFTLNPDATVDDFSSFLAIRDTKPGTATSQLIRRYLLMDGKVITPDALGSLSYGEAVALDQYLSLAFSDTPDLETS